MWIFKEKNKIDYSKEYVDKLKEEINNLKSKLRLQINKCEDITIQRDIYKKDANACHKFIFALLIGLIITGIIGVVFFPSKTKGASPIKIAAACNCEEFVSLDYLNQYRLIKDRNNKVIKELDLLPLQISCFNEKIMFIKNCVIDKCNSYPFEDAYDECRSQIEFDFCLEEI